MPGAVASHHTDGAPITWIADNVSAVESAYGSVIALVCAGVGMVARRHQ